jgi:signal transduction histidine kinase/CheY-like chemotaxis protein
MTRRARVPRRPPSRPRARPDLLVLTALFSVYVLAGKVGLSLAFIHASASAVWPPTGIALAAFLVLGYRAWPAVFAGAFVVNVTTAGSAATSLGIAVGNTLEGMVGAYLVVRFANGVAAFDRAHDVFKFAGLAAGLSTILGATTGVTSLALGGYANRADLGSIWLTWWLGDATGALIFTPLLVLWARTATGDRPGRRTLETAGLFLSTILIGFAVFGQDRALTFLLTTPLIWAAFRFKPREVVTLMAVLSTIAIGQTVRGSGPFATGTAHESLLLLQAFLGTLVLMILPAAAVVEERRRAGQEREELLVREQAARAEAQRADRAKDEFLATVRHELHNPLAVIISAVSVLERSGDPDDSAVRARGAIRHQITHLSRLIDDLLDVAGVSGGRIVLACRPLNLATSVERSVNVLADTGRLERHVVDVRVEPVWVDADPARLDQIVSTLLTNATRYTPPGGAIRVRVGEEGGEAVLRVEDTGVGIAPELLPRIFDLVAQDARGPDRRPAGLGVGLALVRRLAELHRGRAVASSDGPGCGSVFVVRLPRIASPRPETERVRTARPPASPRRRALIVEDDADACKMLRLALELAGHEVQVVDDGYKALNSAAIHRPEIILISTELHGMDGYEIARRLRMTQEGADLRLLALTAQGQPFDRLRGLNFNAHLEKPVNPRELGLITRRWATSNRGDESYPQIVDNPVAKVSWPRLG